MLNHQTKLNNVTGWVHILYILSRISEITMENSVKAFADALHLIELEETTLERADFTLQLLMFVTAEREGRMFIIFFLSSYCQLLSPQF